LFYRISDYAEAFSIVISEAWIRKKAVIGSSVGAIPYRIKEGYNGFLFNKTNFKELADKMIGLTQNRELANSMSNNGRKEVKT
jgi:glycosyltransferase involved in cell wall biosynthesis